MPVYSRQKPVNLHLVYANMQEFIGMDWDNLKVVLAIGRAGSLTGAAQILGIDQSTVGRKLTSAERDLGTILFVRSKSGFVPTQSGQIALQQAEAMDYGLRQMGDDISEAQSDARGTVRIVGNAWMMRELAGHGAHAFLRDNPKIDLRFLTRMPRVRISGEASIPLWFELPPHASEFSVALGKVPYAVYRSAHIETEPDHWVSFWDEEAERPIIESAGERLRGRTGQIRFTSTDAGVLTAAVAAGVGRGLLPACLARGRDDLVRDRTGAPELERILYMHHNPDILSTKRFRLAVNWLREIFPRIFLALD